MDLKEKIWDLIKRQSRGDALYWSGLTNQILTLFQTHLEEQLEGLKVIDNKKISKLVGQMFAKDWGFDHALKSAAQAQRDYDVKQLRDIWRDK